MESNYLGKSTHVKFFLKFFAGSTLMKIVYRSKEDFFYGTPKSQKVVALFLR